MLVEQERGGVSRFYYSIRYVIHILEDFVYILHTLDLVCILHNLETLSMSRLSGLFLHHDPVFILMIICLDQ